MSTSKARELRKNPTDVEQSLWKHLRLHQIGGYKFRRQTPIGSYIVDFVCFENRLIIELDGGHHNQQGNYDAQRTEWLERQGFRVMRFWNNWLLEDIEAVKLAIFEALKTETPPLP